MISATYCMNVEISLFHASLQTYGPLTFATGGLRTHRGVCFLYSRYSAPKIDSSTPSSYATISVYSIAKITIAIGRNQITPDATTKPIQIRKFTTYRGFRIPPQI